MGFGIATRLKKLAREVRLATANTIGRPRLYRLGTPERLGVIFNEPSDMCVSDRTMLYALIRGLQPERVVEIGVRWGGGARIIAAALEDAGGHGHAIGTDPEPQAFRPTRAQLFGRYELLPGRSPQAIPDAVKKLGGRIDFAFIDAMHTHDHVLADFRGVLPYLATGAHVLLHDAYHQGIDRAAAKVLADNPHLVDCGFITRHPQLGEAPVAYQGLRLIRAGTESSQQIITGAYRQAGRPDPQFREDLLNWDYYWNRVKKRGELSPALVDEAVMSPT